MFGVWEYIGAWEFSGSPRTEPAGVRPQPQGGDQALGGRGQLALRPLALLEILLAHGGILCFF